MVSHSRSGWCPGQLLQSHSDQEYTHFVLRDLSEGFHIGYAQRGEGQGLHSSARNRPSSLTNQRVITAYLEEEIEGGQFVGLVSPLV